MDLQELEAVANREIAKHGLYGWTFAFAATKRRLGVCKFQAKRIEIAEFYAANNPPESVLDTLFHEIAHALAGPRAGHGPNWKAIAIRLAQPLGPATSHLIPPSRRANGRQPVWLARRSSTATSVR